MGGRVFVSVRSPRLSKDGGGGSRELAPRSLSSYPASSLLSLDACRSSPFSAPLPPTSAVPAGLALLPWVGCAQTFFLFLSLSLSFCTSARLPTPCRSSFVSC